MSKNPAEIWAILKSRYKLKTRIILYQLQCQFNMIKMIDEDRKSTRLNSSHLGISYAVFCLKKKKIRTIDSLTTCVPQDTSQLFLPPPSGPRALRRPPRSPSSHSPLASFHHPGPPRQAPPAS